MSEKLGINVIGYVSGNLGLGVIARQFVGALIANGHAVSILDLDAGQGRSGVDRSFEQHFVGATEELPHGVNLWIIGADRIVHTGLSICKNSHLQSKFNAVFVWWELPNIPFSWSVSAQAFDALITGSEFVREVWANNVPHTPVLLAQSPLELPSNVVANRARFGLPGDAFVIYTGFEPASDLIRKNPFAAVRAFRHAFPFDAHARLMIKINNPSSEQRTTEIERLYSMVEKDERILFLHERLSYADLLSLYASCDVMVSLHRAEGLALVPLEAMRLGKPVIATGWSGNMTYMNHSNSGLVSYDFVDVDETSSQYAPSLIGVRSRWAEPDVEHAAAWLRAFAEDRIMCKSFGERARRDSMRYHEVASRTEFANDLAAMHTQRSLKPAKNYTLLGNQIFAAGERQRLQHLSAPRRALAQLKEVLEPTFNRYIGWRFRPAKPQ